MLSVCSGFYNICKYCSSFHVSRCPLLDLLLCVCCSLRHQNASQFIAPFTLPAGAGAVIPVSEGSDGGHCWPVGVAAHHKSTEPPWTTLQFLSSLMGSLGGEYQRVMEIKIPGLAPTRRYYVGRSKCAAHAAAATFTSLHRPRNPKSEFGGLIIMCVSGICPLVSVSSHSCCIFACLQLDPVESDTVYKSGDGELGYARAEVTLLDVFWSFPAKLGEREKSEKTLTWMRNKELRVE